MRHWSGSDQGRTDIEVIAAPPELIERDAEVAAISAALEQASAGAGRSVLIEGPPGIGKTRLLQSAAELAGERGMLALQASGSELERELALGAVRELFESELSEMQGGQREEILSGATTPIRSLFDSEEDLRARDPDALAHAVYWLASNFAERRPLVLLLDDAQWIDRPSLRALAFVARRIEELPLALVIATRPGPNRGPELGELSHLARDAGQLLAPAPLSPSAAGVLIEAAFDRAPDPDVASACHEATEGNPQLLNELCRLLSAQLEPGTAPTRSDVEGRAPESHAAAAIDRLRRHLDPERSVAAAAAILGSHARLRHVAALSDLDLDSASRAADALVGSGLLEAEAGAPLRFAHPTIGEAVASELPPGERSRLHAAAARLLEREGAPADAIAAHLINAEPAGEPWAFETLREAARLAESRGGPTVAAGHLRRALAEPPPPELRATTLEALGRAESRAADPAAIEHLEDALRLTESAVDRGRLSVRLGGALSQLGRMREAKQTLERALGEIGDRDTGLALELSAGALMADWVAGESSSALAARLERLRSDSAGDSKAERVALATLAWGEAMAGRSAGAARDLAERGLRGGDAGGDVDAPPYFLAITALVSADAYDSAEEVIGMAISEARRRGSALAYSMACGVATYLHYRRGRLEEAVVQGENAAVVASHSGLPWGMPVAPGWLCAAYVARGELDRAEAALAGLDLDGPADNVAFDIPRHARGVLRAARGDHEGALADFLSAGESQTAWGAINPSLLPWRSNAALAAHSLGRDAEARRHAAEEVALARCYGAPRAVAVALRVQGLVTGGEKGLEDLRAALAAAEAAGANVERARASIELGAAIRRTGREREARVPLKEGLDLATKWGAAPLAERGREELLAAGGRPRRTALSGVDSLTPSEQRIARLAMGGSTNRQIAQELFVSIKTVEMHLRNAYRKLGIDSREGLATALAAPVGRG